MEKIFKPWSSLCILVIFMKKEPPAEFYGVFDHFSRADEVTNDFEW